MSLFSTPLSQQAFQLVREKIFKSLSAWDYCIEYFSPFLFATNLVTVYTANLINGTKQGPTAEVKSYDVASTHKDNRSIEL
jgi:hypothetical protein